MGVRSGTGRQEWLVALVPVAAFSFPASAICADPPALSDAFVPLAGRVDVPTNVSLVVPTQSLSGSVTATPEDGGALFLFTTSTVNGVNVLRPDRELTPDTTFLLCADGCIEFTTGAGRDDEAPAAPTAAVTDVHGYWALDTPCGDGANATVVVVIAEPAVDTATLVLSRTLSGVTSIEEVRFVDDGDEEVGLVDHAEEGGDANYSVVAFDLAGNASAPTTMGVPLGCGGSCAHADAGGVLAGVAVLAARRRRRVVKRAS